MSIRINFIRRKTFRQRVWKTLNVIVGVSTILSVSMVGALIQPRAAAAQTSESESLVLSTLTTSATDNILPINDPNPVLGQTCGLDIGLIVDTSESVDSTEMGQMKTALKNFAGAFVGTPTVFSLSSFSEESQLDRAFSRTPEQMSGLDANSGDISTDIPSVGNSYTNWDSGLARGFLTFDPRPTKPNLIVIATDGSPNHWGYPSSTGIYDVNLALSHAVTRANIIKSAGTRIVVIGIGEDTTDPATPDQKLDKMKAISGTSVALTPAEISTITDVIKVTNFSGIGDAVAAYAKSLCGGKILVQKKLDTNDDGQVDLDGTIADPRLSGWGFDVNGTASNPTPQVTTNTGALEFSDILNGSDYSVIEAPMENTKLVDASCSNGVESVGKIDLISKTISGLTMGTDDTISCTFLNSLTEGTVTVIKHVINDDGGKKIAGDFTFHVSNGTPKNFPGNENGTAVTVPAGTKFSVTEDTDAGYASSSTGDCAGTMTTDASLTCTITNNDIRPMLTITKVVVNNNGGTKNVSDFPLFVGSTPVISGATNAFPVGTYTVSETSLPTYRGSITGDCAPDGTVTLNPGDEKSCTLTNHDRAPSLTIIKHVINDNGGQKVASDFTLDIVGTAVTTSFPGQEKPGTVLDVRPGSYVVTEKKSDGYAMSYSSDCQAMIAFGEQKTCTVTNDDIGPTIQLAKSTTETTITAGGNITYTLAWSITGKYPVTNAVITDTLPTNTTFVSATCGTTIGTCLIGPISSTISWNLGSRPGESSGTVTLTLKTSSPVANGTVITNTACFDTDQNTNLCDPASTTIQSAPSLSIIKTNNVIGFTNPGKQVTYTVTVTNASTATDTAHAVILSDVLPSGFLYTLNGGSTKNFTLGDIAPSASVVTTYTATISSTQAIGLYPNVATALGSNTAKVSATSNVEIRLPVVLGIASEPNLVLTKTASDKTTSPGEAVTYTVTMSNTGDIDLTNVSLADKLPKGFLFADTDRSTKTWNIGTLKAHRQRVINYLVNVGTNVKAGTYFNLATVLTNELDPLTAMAKIKVRVPQVLGLTSTGPSWKDYLLFSFGLAMVSIGSYWLDRQRRQKYGSHFA